MDMQPCAAISCVHLQTAHGNACIWLVNKVAPPYSAHGTDTGGGRLVINVSSLAVLSVGGMLVLSGRLSLGALLSVNLYNTFLAVGLAQLAGSLGDFGKALGALQRCAGADPDMRPSDCGSVCNKRL